MSSSINRNIGQGFLGFNSDDDSDPRKTSFFAFLKNFLCPTFNFLSFTFIITMVDIVVFIITVALGIDRNPYVLLAPLNTTLNQFGMKNPYLMQHGEVWRFVTYALLHANFMHVFVNCISQIIICSVMEAVLGWWRTMILYFSIA